MRRSYSEMSEQDRQKALSELVSLQEVCDYLETDSKFVFILMSEKKLPGWLVGGTWKFHLDEIDEWLGDIGGKDAVKAHKEDWDRRKKEAQQAQSVK